METFISIITVLFLSISANAMTRIGIIDTGFSGIYNTKASLKALCKEGHYDFDMKSPTVGYDEMGHGSFVANIIAKETVHTNYCLQIYKVFGKGAINDPKVVSNAIVKAVKNGATLINLSLTMFNHSEYDKKVVRWATKRGVKIYAAAGNESTNLNKVCKSYPSCYNLNDNLIRVGALNRFGKKADYSNYGMSVAVYKFGMYDSKTLGTSFAAPRALAFHLNETEGN